MIADQHCPECRGVPDLLLVRKDSLVKRCKDCGHKWNEERVPEKVGVNGWIGERKNVDVASI